MEAESVTDQLRAALKESRVWRIRWAFHLGMTSRSLNRLRHDIEKRERDCNLFGEQKAEL
jgi:hypothetical protein